MTVFIGKNPCSSELYKVTQATIWTYQNFLTQRLKKGYAPFLHHLGFSRHENSTKTQDDLCQWRFWTEQRKEGSVPLTRVTTGSEFRPEVQPVPPHEEPSWPIVWDWSGSGAEFSGILSNSELGVSCAMSSVRVLQKDHQHQRRIRKVRESTNKRRKSITTEEKQTRS